MSFRLILHIGINKTATTAIQRFLSARQDELLRHGVLYPQAGRHSENHHALSRLLGFGPKLKIDQARRDQQLTEIKKSLRLECSSSNSRAAIISSENFMVPRPIEPVVKFFEGMDVTVLVYLRRHDSWRESAYSQGLRMVSNPSGKPGFEGWLEFQERSNSKYGDYRLLLDTWAEAFGKERLIVRPYEKQQNQPDIVTDFLHSAALGDVADKVNVKVPRVNESLSIRAMNLLEAFQRMDVTPSQLKLLVKHACSLEPDKVKKSVVPPAVRRRLVDDNQADYEYIAREYLGREDGRLFYDPLPAPDEAWQPPPCLTTEEIEIEKKKLLSLMNKLKRIIRI